MPTSPMLTGAGATGLRIVQLRPAFSSWGLGVGKHGGESLAFFIQPKAELSSYGSLNTFGRKRRSTPLDLTLRASNNSYQR
ncbi:hypothetical protein ES708_32586 [subsurface metagenome]